VVFPGHGNGMKHAGRPGGNIRLRPHQQGARSNI
jgi:hypothetical protein